jgi:hypothetical protein
MFRSLISILLIVSMICSSFSRYVVMVSFEMNKTYIISSLCENKARPELMCNGKCFLNKKLKEADDNEKKQSQKSEQKNIDLFSTGPLDRLNMEICFFPELISTSRFYYNFTYFFNNVYSIFRPPQHSATIVYS